ncbi:MAG: hypothetical protein ACI35Q_01950 [Marinilabiliaceae bacterium]
MTKDQFYNAVENPDDINPDSVDALAQAVRRFPYFHAGWMLLAKGLADSSSPHFQSELRKAAVHVWDRAALFWLVNGADESRKAKKPDAAAAAKVNEAEHATTPGPAARLLTPPPPVADDYFPGVADDLGIDAASKPDNTYSLTDFDDHLRRPSERYTFADWLDYVSERKSILDEEAAQDRNSRQSRLIDDFLREPVERITPAAAKPISQSEAKAIEERSVSENDEILTETLASIYLKQGKTEKAVSIFKKLSLKYPEKSSYFASRIAEIQK